MGVLWSAAFLKLITLMREMQSGELGRCFLGCSEKDLSCQRVPRKEFLKDTSVTRDEAANMVAAGKLHDEADGWRSKPKLQTTIRNTGTFSSDKK